MLFTSLEFLFAFLPIVLLVNFLLPAKARNYWLLMMSLLFYAWGEPRFVLVMLGSIIVNYLMALKIADIQVPAEPGIAQKRAQNQKEFLFDPQLQ